MFWSDPNLYGASLPYKDIPTPVQTPLMGPVFSPWQNIPRFFPTYGYTPTYFNLPHIPQAGFNVPQMGFPQIPQMGFNVPQMGFPQVPQMGFNVPQFGFPQVPQMGFNVPPTTIDPWAHARAVNPLVTYNPNLPLYNPYRPFTL